MGRNAQIHSFVIIITPRVKLCWVLQAPSESTPGLTAFSFAKDGPVQSHICVSSHADANI